MEASADARGPISRGLRSRVSGVPCSELTPDTRASTSRYLCSSSCRGGKRFELRSYRKNLRKFPFISSSRDKVSFDLTKRLNIFLLKKIYVKITFFF